MNLTTTPSIHEAQALCLTARPLRAGPLAPESSVTVITQHLG